MKKYLVILVVFISFSTFSQKLITLDEAIKIAQKKSPDYQALLNQNQAAYWRYRNFRASFLPQLRFDATIPQYENSIRSQNQDDGSVEFIRSKFLRLDGALSLNQNIDFTGGTISVSSTLERVDVSEPRSQVNYGIVFFL